MKKIGETLRCARKKKGLTGEQLADLLFVTKQTVSKWENDKSIPDIETLIRLSTLLDLDLDELLKENGASAHAQPPATELQAQESARAPEPREIEVLGERSDQVAIPYIIALVLIASVSLFTLITLPFLTDKSTSGKSIFYLFICIPFFLVCLIFFLIQKNTPKAAIIRCGEYLRIYNGGNHYKQILLREIASVRELHGRFGELTKFGSLRIQSVTGQSVTTAVVSNVAEVHRKIIEAKMIAEQRAR